MLMSEKVDFKAKNNQEIKSHFLMKKCQFMKRT